MLKQPIQKVDKTEINKGDGIKLKYENELFWVIFQEKKGKKMVGIIDNHLSNSRYKYGDRIEFEEKYIWAIMTPAKRQKQLLPLLQFIFKFQAIYGRKPTLQEFDMLLTI